MFIIIFPAFTRARVCVSLCACGLRTLDVCFCFVFAFLRRACNDTASDSDELLTHTRTIEKLRRPAIMAVATK